MPPDYMHIIPIFWLFKPGNPARSVW